jgi:hypothetical protein
MRKTSGGYYGFSFGRTIRTHKCTRRPSGQVIPDITFHHINSSSALLVVVLMYSLNMRISRSMYSDVPRAAAVKDIIHGWYLSSSSFVLCPCLYSFQVSQGKQRTFPHPRSSCPGVQQARPAFTSSEGNALFHCRRGRAQSFLSRPSSLSLSIPPACLLPSIPQYIPPSRMPAFLGFQGCFVHPHSCSSRHP